MLDIIIKSMKKKLYYLIGFSILVSLNMNAAATQISQDKNVLSVREGKSFHWYFEGKKLDGVYSHKFIAMQSGTYSVRIETEEREIITETVHVNLETGKIRRIHLVGDSTMADYSTRSDYAENYYPVTGWGEVFQPFMRKDSLVKVNHFIDADSIEVIDWAIGGRSTRLFYEEGTWEEVYNAIQPGDYVMIQFGHNDASENHPDRYVDTAGFKMYLKLFAQQTREKGGIPVFITPVNRNYPWSGGIMTSVHGDYPLAMKQAADASKTALIDLTSRSCEFFTSKGKEYVTNNYFMTFGPHVYEGKYWETGSSDGTHFQPAGAVEVARLVFRGLQDLRLLDISMSDPAAGKVPGSRWHDTKYTAELEIPAYSNRGWVFENWTGDVNSNANPLVLNLNEDMRIMANYRTTDKSQYVLSTNVEGKGEVSYSPFGGLYEGGSTVAMNAKASTNNRFFSWTGDLRDTVNPLNYTISKNSRITGLFVESSAQIFQPERATLTNCHMESNEFNQTGDNCIRVEKNTDCSMEWQIIPEEKAYLSMYFRYKNPVDSAAAGNIYINDEPWMENFSFPVTGTNDNWNTIRIGGYSMGDTINKVKLEFLNPAEYIFIDFIKIPTTKTLLDSYTTVKDFIITPSNLAILPNPLTPASKMFFTLEKDSNAVIEVYKLNGQKERVVFSGNLAAGFHEIDLNEFLFESGIYICKLTTNLGLEVSKFVVK